MIIMDKPISWNRLWKKTITVKITLLSAAAATALLIAHPSTAAAGPAHQYSAGQSCPGASIGMKADDPATGQFIVCDTDYTWHVYTGQTPHHSWADDQN
jgi:hypothetical protein